MMIGISGRLALVSLVCLMTLLVACGSPARPSCSSIVSQPAATTFGPEGGTGTAAITTSSGCSWTATSSGSFLTISEGATGSGNGLVEFRVALNEGADRVANLVIDRTTIAISQRASVAPLTLSAPVATAPIGDQYIPDWPTLVVNNATSTGNIGTVTYHFELSDDRLFPADPQRTMIQDGVVEGIDGTTAWVVTRDLMANIVWYWRARATAAAVTSEFSDLGTFVKSAPCTYALDPTGAAVTGSAGATSTISVTTASLCNWSAVSNDPFIVVHANASGRGNGSVTYTVQTNSGAERTGTIGVASETFTVTQTAG